MQIVIDIGEKRFRDIQRIAGVQLKSNYFKTMEQIIAEGIPLPKGHGELKDMGNLQYVFDLTREDHIYSGKDIERAIKSMKTIIEAERRTRDENITNS